MENQNSIKEIINNAMKDVRSAMDTNTVFGEPIRLDNGITVVPISKVSMGFASGGLDLPANANGSKSFGAGGGTGVTVAPIGFLTSYPDGRIEVIPVTPTEMGPVEQIADVIERAPEIIGRIRSIFAGEDEETEEEMSELQFDDSEDAVNEKKSRKKKK
jgi:uncharacterized spore protein YtfJ